LAEERKKVEAMDGPDASYSGPHYEGPSSVTDQFITDMMAMFEKDVRLPIKYASRMVLDFIDVLGKEPTLRKMSIPEGKHLTMIGDTHGQFYDFMTIVEKAGRPSPDSPFLFNGDFVDRGSWSTEVIFSLIAFKLKDPEFVGMNRGNHEMLEANLIYGFCGEVSIKYNLDLFDLFSEAFRRLPLATLVEEKVLCVHGGLPGPNPRIWMPGQTHDPTDAIPARVVPASLDDIAKVDRNSELGPSAYRDSIGPATDDKEINDERMTIDLLWSDPRGGMGYGPTYRKSRGVYLFGPDVTEGFLKHNNLQAILRSHEVKKKGFQWDHPRLCTVFSAPNYLDTGDNQGAFMKMSKNASGEIDFDPVSFDAKPHPDLAPMHWQSHIMENYPHLVRKMRKRVSVVDNMDDFGDSDYAGGLMDDLLNFDEWEPDEADQFQDAFASDEYGRPLNPNPDFDD